MKLFLKNIKDILDKDLSLLERGILISILLSKDDDERITLAKFKTTCKINSIKRELIELQDKGYIEWSGYKSAKKSINDFDSNQTIEDIINFMNDLYRTKFNRKAKSTTSNLRARLKEYSIEDIKLVISNRYSEWKDDSVMNKYLNPTTIFRPSKFEKYLEEARRTKVGMSFVAAESSSLNHGDEITFELSKDLIDSDIYNIKIYQLDSDGNKRGSGRNATRYGRDIKMSLKTQQLLTLKEYKYFYVQK